MKKERQASTECLPVKHAYVYTVVTYSVTGKVDFGVSYPFPICLPLNMQNANGDPATEYLNDGVRRFLRKITCQLTDVVREPTDHPGSEVNAFCIVLIC